MTEMSPAQLALYGAALVAIALLGARWLARDDPAPARPETGAVRIERDERGGRVVVHVVGEVRHPGVYRLRAGARVAQALRRAGGATRRGDLTRVNLAAEAQDGRQVIVPARAGAGGGSPAPGEPSGPLSLGTATAEQLDALPGVGPATAAAILEYRDSHGGFGAVEELDAVPGIGPATLAQLADLVVP